ncbi:MAG: hypothetical protein BGO78_11970 [Chloroflexi bacterium 44-23]|nr:MAG: hypothetical protein BGO78_11970 [Chloroflexi bacterium 44-23]
MLSINQIYKSYGLTTVLKDVTFTINRGERWGLVGLNGSGKSTLLRILAGEEKADRGSFHFSPHTLQVGYLPQGFRFTDEVSMQEFLDTNVSRLDVLTGQLSNLAQQLVSQPMDSDLQKRYDATLLELSKASLKTDRLPVTLAALSLDTLSPEIPISHLSGGQKTRLMLASLLLNNPDLLLLDEPTNHLDIEMLTWLENWITSFQGGILLVSHDRAFLNHTVNRILELDEHSHEVRFYNGNYDDYLGQKTQEREQQIQAFKDQQDQIRRLQHSAREIRARNRYHKGGKTDPKNTDGFAIGFFANRGKEVDQKAKNIEKRVERMLNEDKIDKPARSWQMHVAFDQPQIRSREVLVMEGLRVGYPGLTLIDQVNLTLLYGQHIALIGANGSGKTSLIKTICGQIAPLSGTCRLGSSIQPGLMSQEQNELDLELNALQSLQKVGTGNETELRRFLSLYLFNGDEVFVPVANMSYGERARLALACLIAAGCNFLMLDEPINHLDIPSRTNFETALAQFDGSVLAVVHDRYFIEGFAHQIWDLREKRIWVREVSTQE